ncbi:MAG: hypothetical protein CMN30_05075 [Sandaracinus sp.]|nr:hypothetical protein [Sandaracinus sp.]
MPKTALHPAIDRAEDCERCATPTVYWHESEGERICVTCFLHDVGQGDHAWQMPASSTGTAMAPSRGVSGILAAMSDVDPKVVKRLRAICLALPEAEEVPRNRDPSWQVRGQVFADQHDHFENGRPAASLLVRTSYRLSAPSSLYPQVEGADRAGAPRATLRVPGA